MRCARVCASWQSNDGRTGAESGPGSGRAATIAGGTTCGTAELAEALEDTSESTNLEGDRETSAVGTGE